MSITAQNGRYGPVPEEGHRLALAAASEDQLLTITPRRGARRSTHEPEQLRWASRGRSASSELGHGPRVRARQTWSRTSSFGPDYVTDGEFNATLRKDDTVEAITLERAAELLAERRAKGPAKKTAKRGAKKAPAKKSAAKKTTKKAAAKK